MLQNLILYVTLLLPACSLEPSEKTQRSENQTGTAPVKGFTEEGVSTSCPLDRKGSLLSLTASFQEKCEGFKGQIINCVGGAKLCSVNPITGEGPVEPGSRTGASLPREEEVCKSVFEQMMRQKYQLPDGDSFGFAFKYNLQPSDEPFAACGSSRLELAKEEHLKAIRNTPPPAYSADFYTNSLKLADDAQAAAGKTLPGYNSYRVRPRVYTVSEKTIAKCMDGLSAPVDFSNGQYQNWIDLSSFAENASLAIRLTDSGSLRPPNEAVEADMAPLPPILPDEVVSGNEKVKKIICINY